MVQLLGLEDAAALFLLRACSSWQVTHWNTVGEIAQGMPWLKQWLSVPQCCAALGHICSISPLHAQQCQYLSPDSLLTHSVCTAQVTVTSHPCKGTFVKHP